VGHAFIALVLNGGSATRSADSYLYRRNHLAGTPIERPKLSVLSGSVASDLPPIVRSAGGPPSEEPAMPDATDEASGLVDNLATALEDTGARGGS
jgi:hypothetical protein